MIERTYDPRSETLRGPSPGEPAGSGGDGLESNRTELRRLFASGDGAIDRILSGSSEDFLRAGRQHGGQ